jgi:hypothetical protein
MEGTGVKYPPLPQRKSLSPKKLLISSQNLPLDSVASTVDFSLLDYKQPDDFLARYCSPGDERILLEQMAYQLKVSRGLLELSTATAKSSPGDDVVGRLIDCAQAIVDAEKIVFIEIDSTTGDLFVNGSTSGQQPEITRIRSGIECSCSLHSSPLSPHLICHR